MSMMRQARTGLRTQEACCRRGQAMVEYMVIVSVIFAAIVALASGGRFNRAVGTELEEDSLMDRVRGAFLYTTTKHDCPWENVDSVLGGAVENCEGVIQ